MQHLPKSFADALHATTESPTDDVVAIRIGLALGTGLVVAGLYHLAIGRHKRDTGTMPLTLVLMSVLVCMVMLIIGNDIARAFTLGGALAIIRFRTVVDDTRDTAFVIASVVVGMGMGTGHSAVIFVGLPIFAVALLGALFVQSRRNGGLLRKVIIKLPLQGDPDQLTASAFAALGAQPTLLNLETAKQGSALEATYHVWVKDQAAVISLMNALRQIEGVQGVEVKPLA